MELPSQDEDMPLPINSTYVGGGHGHGHMIHHDPTPPNNTNHIIPPSMNGPPIDAPPVATAADHHVPFKKMVRYSQIVTHSFNYITSKTGSSRTGLILFIELNMLLHYYFLLKYVTSVPSWLSFLELCEYLKGGQTSSSIIDKYFRAFFYFGMRHLVTMLLNCVILSIGTFGLNYVQINCF